MEEIDDKKNPEITPPIKKKAIVLQSIGEKLELKEETLDNSAIDFDRLSNAGISEKNITVASGSKRENLNIRQIDKAAFRDDSQAVVKESPRMALDSNDISDLESKIVIPTEIRPVRVSAKKFAKELDFSEVSTASEEVKPVKRKRKIIAEKIDEDLVLEKKEFEHESVSVLERREAPSLTPVSRINSLYNKDKAKSRKMVMQKKRRKRQGRLVNWAQVRPRLLKIFLASTILAMAAYLVLWSMAVFLQSQKLWFLRLSRVIPLYVAYADNSVFDYVSYLELKTALGIDVSNDRFEGEMKKALQQKAALYALARKYKLTSPDTALIDEKVLLDEDINRESLERIRSLSKQVTYGDFVRLATQLADESGQIDLNRETMSKYSFFEQIKDLEPGQISPIITGQGGYYLFRCYDKTTYNSALSFLFVKNKNLEDYLNQSSQSLRVFDAIAWANSRR